MQAVKQKVSNAAAAAKEHVDVMKAKAEEKRELSMARTKEEEAIATERRKAKEAEANMRLHATKADNAAVKLQGKQKGLFGNRHHGTGAATVGQGNHYPTGTTAPMSNTTAPGYGNYNATGGTITPTTNIGGHRRHHHHGLK
ncbi:hypothetical protein F511_00520 [Dorcoceras hygrometricum]|uniref:LEA n=1 Tax=Dorcoceras hygrometricum TaxID=472368 RepID=B4XU16_9LAMI|nr:LEA [Dorcoceras hygrometricum]KZV31716.1 hypothetical protein F511_00520 [Dorcoceras hygrometricum]